MNLLVILLSCIGLTFILKYGSILSSIRKPLTKIPLLKELFSCSLCLGFWSGVFHLLFLYKTEWNEFYILLPLVSSAVCWFADCLINLIQSCELFIDKTLEK